MPLWVQYCTIFGFYTLSAFLLLRLLPIQIFLYRGVVAYFLASLGWLVFYFSSKRLKRFYPKESFLGVLSLAFALNWSFFVLFPLTFERSVTIALLETLHRQQQTKSCDCDVPCLEQILEKEYLTSAAIEKRVAEQSVVGIVAKKNGCVQLTKKGWLFLRFVYLVKALFGI